MIHDDHLADHIRSTLPVRSTTADVDAKADRIIAEFETFRRNVARGFITAGVFIGAAGGGVIWLVVTR